MIEIIADSSGHYLRASGHANSGEYGRDLICAGVSCILTGFCNYLIDEMDLVMFDNGKSIGDFITLRNGFCEIDLRGIDFDGQTYSFNVVLAQLHTIEAEYPQHIWIKYVDDDMIEEEREEGEINGNQ